MVEKMKKKYRIELCGEIAAGKSTLAQILSEEKGLKILNDRFEENPFLKSFYMDKYNECAFESELTFALLHFNMTRNNSDFECVVCDYSVAQDFSYAKTHLNETEFQCFCNVYKMMLEQIGFPDLTIYLKCPVEELKKRIKKRGRVEEQEITNEHLECCVQNLEIQLSKINNVLVIDSSKYDFRGKDKTEVIDYIFKNIEEA